MAFRRHEFQDDRNRCAVLRDIGSQGGKLLGRECGEELLGRAHDPCLSMERLQRNIGPAVGVMPPGQPEVIPRRGS